MPQTRTAGGVTLALAVLALAAGLFALSRGGVDGSGELTRSSEGAAAPATDAGDAELGALDAPDEERQEARTAAEVTPGDQEAAVEEAHAALSVVVEPYPWFGAEPVRARVTWRGETLPGLSCGVGEAVDARAVLAGVPRSIDEFGAVTVADLQARPVALLGPEVSGTGSFLLRVEVVDGLEVRWSPDAGPESNGPVSLAFGGSLPPSSREFYSHGRRKGLLQELREQSLPASLPRPRYEELIWVGAPGYQWRSFPVEPDTEVVEVELTRASSIRVLHDGPVPGERRSVVVTSFPKGETEVKTIEGPEPIVFTERDPVVHEVRVVAGNPFSRPGRPERLASRLARLELQRGEESVVDLTAAFEKEAFGKIALTLEGGDALLGKHNREIQVSLSRRVESPGKRAWERKGMLSGRSPGRVIEREYLSGGVEPGEYRVIIDPLGVAAEAIVEAGAITEVVVDLESVGWAILEAPEGVETAGSFISFSTADEEPRERLHFSAANEYSEPGVRHPLGPGTYIATLRGFGGLGGQLVESEPFVISAGAETRVQLHVQEVSKVRVRAVDATSGEPVGLELAFWAAVRAIGEDSGRSYPSMTRFDGDGSSYVGLSWQLRSVDEAIRVVPPESDLWTFEVPPAAILRDGDVVTLRASAR